jgi:hypothetical protein
MLADRQDLLGGEHLHHVAQQGGLKSIPVNGYGCRRSSALTASGFVATAATRRATA